MANHKSPEHAKPEAAKPEPRKRHKLPSAEVQTLANYARDAWNAGVLATEVDSTGATWSFLPLRETQLELELKRTDPDPDVPERVGLVSGRELGVDDPTPRLAAIILALAEPA